MSALLGLTVVYGRRRRHLGIGPFPGLARRHHYRHPGAAVVTLGGAYAMLDYVAQ